MNKILQLISRSTPVIVLTISISFNCLAQEGQTIYTSGRTRTIDHSDYDQIKGSPYIYDTWVPAKILASDGIFHDYEKVNYNGLTHQLETITDGVTEEIISGSYIKAIVGTGLSENTFIRGIHPDLGIDIVCILYDGQNVKLIKKFEVEISESVVQTPGVPTEFTSFKSSTDYFVMLERDIHKVRLKKKIILGILDYKTELEKYIKQEKLNLSKESGIVRLLDYYESTLVK